jgi:putative ABC transport system permease protein
MQAYLRQKYDSIAVLKCVGGRSNQILRIYLIQGVAMGTLGSGLGILIGYLVQALFPKLLQDWVELPANLELAPGAALQGFCAGVSITLLFLIPPLLALRKVAPIRLFLRDMPETRYTIFRRLKNDPLPLLIGSILLTGIGLIASWIAGSLRWGFVFMLSLAGCIAVLGAAARLLLFALQKIPRPSCMSLRQGIRNLNRPGNQLVSILIAVGLGVAFILTIYFLQSSLLSQIVKSAPADYPNVFLLGVTQQDKPALQDFLSRHEGIIAHSLMPAIPSRLSTVDGRTADELDLTPHDRRRFRGEFTLTWTGPIPPDTRVVEGRWWSPPFESPMISVGEEAARQFGIRIGSILEFDINGKTVRGAVVNIRDIEFSRPGISNQFMFSPGALEGLPVSYIGAAQMSASLVADFQSRLFRRFPNITSVDVGQVLVRVQDLLDKISVVIRFVALFAIVAGMTILASSVVATRYQRIRETILLKTLGATRAQAAGIQAAEFLIIGLAAGLTGSTLAAIAAHFLLGRLLDTDFDFQWLPLLIATISTAAIAIATGWLANRGVLKHKPLEILREN